MRAPLFCCALLAAGCEKSDEDQLPLTNAPSTADTDSSDGGASDDQPADTGNAAGPDSGGPYTANPDSGSADTGTLGTGAGGETTPTSDLDGDGFSEADGDCDDLDSSVHPEREERCDGLADEAGAIGASPWFEDGDADGFGDPDSRIVACEAPEGFVADNTDCEPSHGDAYPGGIEIAGDGIDQDCDGSDPEAPDSTGSESGWYHGNYDDDGSVFNPDFEYNGDVKCGTTCASYGKTAVGARFVCNVRYALGPSGSTEGCGPHNEGMYGDDNCGWMVRDMVALTENGNTEDCAGGNIMGCVTGTCFEAVTYHSVECQCD